MTGDQTIKISFPIEIAAESHTGLVRKVNEDSYCCIKEPDEENALAVVADGVGGHGGGDVASRICCKKMISQWRLRHGGDLQSGSAAEEFLANAIEEANAEIYEANIKMHRSQPMGSTIVAAVFLPTAIAYAHAGDSRLYRLRGGILEQLTSDHTLRAAMLRQCGGKVDPEKLPPANIICKALGPSAICRPDTNMEMRHPSDRFLLCSDGLSNLVLDSEITDILKTAPNTRTAINKLMRLALIRGGTDNITILCIF